MSAYKLVSAWVKPRGVSTRFEEKDLSEKIVNDLYNDYSKVFLIVEHIVYDKPKVVDIDTIPEHQRPRHSKIALKEWLEKNDNLTLPLKDKLPDLEPVIAPYADAWQSGFEIKPVHRTMHHDMDLPFEELHDIRLYKEGVDVKKFYRECLITVNGLFHRTNYTGEAIHVIDGGRSGACANNNQVGIYHLGKLGELRIAPIRANQVQRGHEDQPMSEVVYVELDPDVEVEERFVFLSIGGYLHFPGKLVTRSGKRFWRVDMKNYPLAQRYFEMKKLLDVSEVERYLTKSSVNDDQMAVEELYSDTVIRAIFCLSQSFFVTVKAPKLFFEREYVEFDQLPRRFVAHQKPIYPLIAGLGRAYEYVPIKEQDRWVLATDDILREYYNLETTNWKDFHSVDSKRTPYRPFEYTRAHFLKIGRYKY